MTNELKIENVHPALRPVVQEFLLKCKYPYIMFGAGRWLSVMEGEEDVRYPAGVAFYDPNAETMQHVGMFKWQQGDFGKPFKFRVVTREVLNPKYRDSERQKSVETGDAKRALKEMLKYFKPFTLDEIATVNSKYADANIARWRAEPSELVNRIFRLPYEVIAKEVAHMMAKGVEFSTPEFQLVAKEGLEAHDELTKRVRANIARHFVKFEKNDTISVRSNGVTSSFTAFELLPTFMQEAIGILKMMRTDQNDTPSIYGVGTCVSENMFWVIEPTEG